MNYPPRSNHNSNGKMTIDETVTSLKIRVEWQRESIICLKQVSKHSDQSTGHDGEAGGGDSGGSTPGRRARSRR